VSRRHFQADATIPSAQQLLTVSLCGGVTLVALLGVLGSGDIGETANSLYSIGALSTVREVSVSKTRTHTILAIPAFNTEQGTGDPLPWPLRFVATSEFYLLVRSLLLIPSVLLCLSTLQTWLGTLSLRRAAFLVLASSSFGLLLRQDDWSDHFVQVIGVSTRCRVGRRHSSSPGSSHFVVDHSHRCGATCCRPHKLR